jgi:VWFA-related protein
MKLAAAVLAAVALSAPLHAQSLTPITESIEVRVTNIDVVVTDRAGQPITGLTKDDFILQEAGQTQSITNFYEIREALAQGDGRDTAPASDVPPEVGRRRVVVFVDNQSIHPISRNQAFDALERSLETLMRPGDECAIVFWNGRSEVISPFTSDRAALMKSFRGAASRSAGGTTLEAARTRIVERAGQMLADAKANRNRGSGLSIEQAYQLSVEQARNFAEQLMAQERELLAALNRTLATMAGVDGKKALIFLGAELPDNPGLDVFQQLDGMFMLDLPNIQPAIMREQNRNMSGEVRALARQANANGVTMYLVDTADRVRSGDPTHHALDMQAYFATATNTPLSMANIAAITGGVAVAGGRSFEKALNTIARDLSSYYSLGYRSASDAEGDRRVVVKVKNPAYRVRSRTSYVARKGDDEMNDRVIANIFHSSVKSDFPVSVTAGAPQKLESGKDYKVQLTVTLPSEITFIPQDGSLRGEFAVFFATAKPDGALSQVSKMTQPMKFPANATKAIKDLKKFTYSAWLVVRPGEQIVSVGVADTLAGTSGFARMSLVAQ